MATSGRAAGDTGPALPELALFAALLSTAMAQCVRPADTIGYELSEVELSITTGFDVVAACAVGYEGSAAVTECSADGDPYALSGCAPIVCTAPPDLSGYDVAEASLLLGGRLRLELEQDGDDPLLGGAWMIAA